MAKRRKPLKLDTIIKIGTFIIAIVGAVIAVLQFSHKPDPLIEERKKVYDEMSVLIGKMINTNNPDSLHSLADEYNKAYNGKMILYEDGKVSIAMRRFKYALEDKLAGVINVGNPNKFAITGMEVIKAFQEDIYKRSK